MDDPDSPNVPHVDRVSSCDSRTSYIGYMRCLQLLLIVRAGRVTINILPDDVLLLIFRFNRMTYIDGLAVNTVIDRARRLPWRWHQLVHVCQRWRSVVFASPKFLDLALVYGPSTPLELIGIWPPLPIIIRDMDNRPMPQNYDLHAAIVDPNRVCEIDLRYITRSRFQRLVSVMQEPFPALIHLRLEFAANFYDDPALPDGFLGGSAPCLRSLMLYLIAFPALPKILLSATDLVRLSLRRTPYSAYISPDVIVNSLAALANLKFLTIELDFLRYRGYRPDQESRRPPPPTRTVLPALSLFELHGPSEYLDDLVARIDTPLLDSFLIAFNHFIIDFSQLARLMRRTTKFNEAHVNLDDFSIEVESLPPTWTRAEESGLTIKFRAVNWQLTNLVQVFTLLSTSIYAVEHLYICGCRSLSLKWHADIENMQWLEICHSFTSVKNLYVKKELPQWIAPALQEPVRERVTDVLPALECLYLEELQPSGTVQEAIGQFVAARQLLGRPVSVSHWKPPTLNI
jgi:hypothetical protein